jgi:hypothetical protein
MRKSPRFEGNPAAQLDRWRCLTSLLQRLAALAASCACGSVRVVGMCLVVCRDRRLRDAAVVTDLEAGVQRPAPDFRCAGLPPRAADFGVWLLYPGQPDRFSDELGGTPRPFHGQFGEYGAGKLTDGPAGPLAFQGAHGFGEFLESEGADPGYRTGLAEGALEVMACGYGNPRPRQRGAASQLACWRDDYVVPGIQGCPWATRGAR